MSGLFVMSGWFPLSPGDEGTVTGGRFQRPYIRETMHSALNL